MIYFSDLVSSVTASVTVKRCLESEANTKIKWKKQSGIMSAVLVSVVNVLGTCVCIWLHRLFVQEIKRAQHLLFEDK